MRSEFVSISKKEKSKRIKILLRVLGAALFLIAIFYAMRGVDALKIASSIQLVGIALFGLPIVMDYLAEKQKPAFQKLRLYPFMVYFVQALFTWVKRFVSMPQWSGVVVVGLQFFLIYQMMNQYMMKIPPEEKSIYRNAFMWRMVFVVLVTLFALLGNLFRFYN